MMQLLVGMLVGSIVLAGAYKAYQLVNEAYSDQMKLMEVATEQLYADSVLERVIEQAGYAGCGNVRQWQNNHYIGYYQSIFTTPVLYGVHHTQKKVIDRLGLTKSGSGQYVPGTDLIITQASGLDGQEVLYKDLDEGSKQVQLDTDLKIKKDDILLVHDCTQFNAVEIISASGSGAVKQVHFAKKLPLTLPAGSIISVYQRNIFYVGKTLRQVKGQPVYALYEKDSNGVRNELVPHITSLQVRYRLLDGRYVSADQVTNWSSIREVELQLKTAQNDQIDKATLAIKRNIP